MIRTVLCLLLAFSLTLRAAAAQDDLARANELLNQQWVADNGSVVWYEGEVRDGAMHYTGEQISAKGNKTLARVLLQPQPDGTVRHRIENSTDGGKTWSSGFDAIYRRAGQAPPR